MAAAFFTGSVIIGNITGNMAKDYNNNDADDKQNGKNGFNYFFHFFFSFCGLAGSAPLFLILLYHTLDCLSRGFSKVFEIFWEGGFPPLIFLTV